MKAFFSHTVTDQDGTPTLSKFSQGAARTAMNRHAKDKLFRSITILYTPKDAEEVIVVSASGFPKRIQASVEKVPSRKPKAAKASCDSKCRCKKGAKRGKR